MALRGMHDVGQNGPENEVNPLIDNGFMYTSDGWGTVYKIDVRSGDHGEFVWIADPGVKHEKNVPQTRVIALWEDLVIGVVHQPTAYNPVEQIVYGLGTEGCSSQNGAEFKFKGPNAGLDAKGSGKRTYTSDLYYGAITAYDIVSHKVLAKAVSDIEIRSNATATAGGIVFSALQDGWVVA
jgi:hypothetical protein